jgi:shikimate kinase
MKSIALIGFMASGKSFLGRIVADKYSLLFYDTDKLIEELENNSVAAIFSSHGEAYFRQLEEKLLANLSNEKCEDALIACGGGIIESKINRQALKKFRVIFLNINFVELKNRLKCGAEVRPLIKKLGMTGIEKLFRDRQKKYLEVADYVVENEAQLNSLIKEIISERK